MPCPSSHRWCVPQLRVCTYPPFPSTYVCVRVYVHARARTCVRVCVCTRAYVERHCFSLSEPAEPGQDSFGAMVFSARQRCYYGKRSASQVVLDFGPGSTRGAIGCFHLGLLWHVTVWLCTSVPAFTFLGKHASVRTTVLPTLEHVVTTVVHSPPLSLSLAYLLLRVLFLSLVIRLCLCGGSWVVAP